MAKAPTQLATMTLPCLSPSWASSQVSGSFEQ
jgi:hypothetical protein